MAKEVDIERLRELFFKAHLEGLAAGEGTTPAPMGVVDEAHKKTWVVPDGMCGFAWITIKPGNSLAARIAKEDFDAHKAYEGGVQIWVHQFNQSITRKEAYANAFSAVLLSAGINAQAGSRLD